MTKAEYEATRRRLQIWEASRELLEEQRWRELMTLSDDTALKFTKALLARPVAHSPVRESSGLVEQQALFQRARCK